MGWTMACGTARIVADLMTGRMPELDLEGLAFGADARCHFATYLVRWPPSDASAIAPTIGLTKTTTPSTKRAFVAAPVFAITAEALAANSIWFC